MEIKGKSQMRRKNLAGKGKMKKPKEENKAEKSGNK